MQDKKHNGWTNYATWRVNLEMFSDNHIFWYNEMNEYNIKNSYALSLQLKDWIENYIIDEGDGIVRDYALAFIEDVNFFEIAEHIVHDYELAHCRNCNDPLDFDTSVDPFCYYGPLASYRII